MSLNILDIVQLGRHGIMHIDNDDFPVRLTFVEQSHDSEYLDLFDLSDVADLFTNFANVERVIVALGLSLWVGRSGILPGLCGISPLMRRMSKV